MRNNCFVMTKGIKFEKTCYLYLILSCCITLYCNNLFSKLESIRYIKSSNFLQIWIKNWDGDSATIQNNIEKNFEILSKHFLFHETLPQPLSVIVDGNWKKSSGYWSNQLRAPDNSQALLMTPASILDPNQNLKLFSHELMHLLHYQFRPHEHAWIKEGLALLTEYLVTGYFNSVLEEGFKNPTTSLIHFKNLDEMDFQIQNELSQYGHVLQYFYFLYRLCGPEHLQDVKATKYNERFIEEILKSKSSLAGIEFLDEVLRNTQNTNPVCENFDKSFTAFEVARFKKNIMKPDGYILISSHRASLQASPGFDLPPYSAGAYILPLQQDGCQKNEIPWGERKCIRIRKE